MTPLESYQLDLQENRIKPDEKQWQAVQCTQRLFSDIESSQKVKPGFIASLLNIKKKTVRGLYLWGGTGRGKTYLVDSFYRCLPGDKKYRIHFHRFMLDIHQQLKDLPKSPNPLEIIAAQLAAKIKVLCLDEFHVHDIADAMLLAGLLKAMFEQGIILVATSNISIHDLYKNGLQRERFMFAIELLASYTEEFDLGKGTDYRFMILGESEHLCILDDKMTLQIANEILTRKFSELAPCKPKTNRSIEINNREIKYISYADDVIWFDCYELCHTNRSAHDYIELAERFHTVIVSGIQQFYEKDDAAAKRFIHFVDAIYDHNVKLMASTEAAPEKLYQGKRMKFAFERTISRLTEMGTQQYLKLAHNPRGTIRKLNV